MTSPDAKAQDEAKPQRLHLVFGGELKSRWEPRIS